MLHFIQVLCKFLLKLILKIIAVKKIENTPHSECLMDERHNLEGMYRLRLNNQDYYLYQEQNHGKSNLKLI